MSSISLISGASADILVYADDNGIAPALEFLHAQNHQEMGRLKHLMNWFADKGIIINDQKFINEGSPIWALKGKQARIFCFYLEDAAKRTLVLTHGYAKKCQKRPQREWNRAYTIYLNYHPHKRN